jgi:hypothetical protein
MSHLEQTPNQEIKSPVIPVNQSSDTINNNTLDWIDIRRDYKINEQGEEVLTNITRERNKEKILGFEKRDFIDFSLRTFALLAIFVPVILFYFGQQKEANKAKTAANLESYSAIAKDLYTITDPFTTTDSIKNAFENFKFNSYLKVKLYGNQALIKKTEELKSLASLYVYAIYIARTIDTFRISSIFELEHDYDFSSEGNDEKFSSIYPDFDKTVGYIDSVYIALFSRIPIEHQTRFFTGTGFDSTSKSDDVLQFISRFKTTDSIQYNTLLNIIDIVHIYVNRNKLARTEEIVRMELFKAGYKYSETSVPILDMRKKYLTELRQVILNKLDEAQSTIENY